MEGEGEDFAQIQQVPLLSGEGFRVRYVLSHSLFMWGLTNSKQGTDFGHDSIR